MHRMRRWLSSGSHSALLALAVVVGVGGAVGAALFHAFIALTTWIFFGDFGTNFLGAVEAMPTWQRILIPTAGGFLVGLVFALSKVSEAEGEGVPEVMEALAVRKGRIRPLVAPIKIITAALTLGSGGSAGREGPVIQIGSAIGSTIAQFFSLHQAHRSLLVAAGAAAAIGGTFGAPLAGIVFTAEILRHRLRLYSVVIIALAAVVGTMGMQVLTGHEGLRFAVAATTEISLLYQIVVALVVGIAAGIGAVLLGAALRGGRLLFSLLPFTKTWLIRPTLGGFVIGIIGVYLPHIHEPAAYPLMMDVLSLTTLPVLFLATVFVVKMVATAITLGSGGSGGIFAPSLLLGAVLGSVVGGGLLVFGMLPEAAVPLVVVVGMAAMFAGVAHAPLTAALITLEMTEVWALAIPLLVGAGVATITARILHRQSIYHEQMDT